ncbi:MAG: redoxin family protein [Phycisphaeraceae bacterium]|nr:redoxin family protein [Phycisphaerales bacterium]MCB9860967.1 redoxin family protein [Phycisphaeraceae bacterium]
MSRKTINRTHRLSSLKLCAVAGSALAASSALGMNDLHIGDRAPDLSASKWFHCDNSPAFSSDKVTVVAFLKSNSSVSQRAIPLLNRAQEELGVNVVGIASMECAKNPEASVEAFANCEKTNIKFPVGCDADREAFDEWAWAAGRPSAPVAFIVDRNENVVWIGNPHHQRFFDELRSAVDGDETFTDSGTTGGTIVTVGSDDEPAGSTEAHIAVKSKEEAKPVVKDPEAVKPAKIVAAVDTAKKETKKADPDEYGWTLTVGDKAPELHLAEFVKGEPITGFESGRVHVVEFWATWCGPCISGMPHLSEVQKEYKEKGVHVMGVNIWDDPKNVEPFMKERDGKPSGDSMMEYTVAIETKDNPDDIRRGLMAKNWMNAAGQTGIPSSFIIDGTGTIAWIGHPTRIDEPLKQIVAGEWNIDTAKQEFEAARIKRAEDRKKATEERAKKAAEEAAKNDDKQEKKAEEKPQQKEQTPKLSDPDTLAVGDKAPELHLAEFVKGDPITGFESGRVYVVEFWATWCGPCIAGMPHVSEIQKNFADKGVRVIGVNAYEDPKAVAPFMEKRGNELMQYTVAIEEKHDKDNLRNGLMATNWMKAAGRNSIPTAFIVDGDSRIAWVGHPAQMDKPLEAIVDGTWDIKKASNDFKESQETAKKAAAERAEAAAKAKAAEEARGKEGLSTGDINKLFTAGETKQGIDAIVKLAQQDATVAGTLAQQKFIAMMEDKNYSDAYALGNAVLGTTINESWLATNMIAWTIVDPEAMPEKQDLDLALRAAQFACKATDNTNPAALDTLAKVYWDMGDKVRALRIQERACSFARGGTFEEELEGRIRFYRENM